MRPDRQIMRGKHMGGGLHRFRHRYALRVRTGNQFLQFAFQRTNGPGSDVIAHNVGCGGCVEPVKHPFGVREPVIGERGIVAVQGHAQSIQAGGACRIPILIAGQLNGELQM